jgi:hypothetical protein
MANGDVATMVAVVLRDTRLVEMEAELRDLREYEISQSKFIAEILQATGVSSNSRQDRTAVPPRQDNCHFCYHYIPRGKGGMCPCGEVGYCSTSCQAVDWRRHHKAVCATKVKPPIGAYRIESPSRDEDEASLEQVD